MSDHQPDPDERHDSVVLEGDDPDHVFPPQELDPFTPEPDPPAHAKTALRVALAVIVLVLVLAVVYALAR
jgi:hypothetical protein